jgi:hypothetical protein
MPLLTRKRLILLESEGTYGTDPDSDRIRRRSGSRSEHHSAAE